MNLLRILSLPVFKLVLLVHGTAGASLSTIAPSPSLFMTMPTLGGVYPGSKNKCTSTVGKLIKKNQSSYHQSKSK